MPNEKQFLDLTKDHSDLSNAINSLKEIASGLETKNPIAADFVLDTVFYLENL